MKKNKEFPYLILAFLILWCPLFMAAFDKDKPSSSTSLRDSNPEILANWSALETALAQDHEFSTGGTNSGKHEVLTMEEETSAGASSTNELHIQAIDGGSGQPELAVTSEDGNELQMTKDGDLFSSAGLTVTNASTFNGSITLGAGDDLIGSSTSDITFNTNKFTVAGATGNTVIAGTCDITGATEVIGITTLSDGSLLKTSAAPTTDAMIANKKYVDDTSKDVTDGDPPTTLDWAGDAFVIAHAYWAAWGPGFVNAYATGATTSNIQAYVGATNDPAGAGTRVDYSDGPAGHIPNVFFFVPRSMYFEVTAGETLTITWTSLWDIDLSPIDQD